MELSQLRAIQALAELRSFTLAGERLHLSPPAVFSQIRQLEARLGGRLYEKTGRTLTLTPKGKLLAEHANRIVSAHDLAFEEITGRATSRREVLRVGAGPYSAVHVVPYLLRAFLCGHPDTEARFATADDRTLVRGLRESTLDAALMTVPSGDSGLEELRLWSYEMVMVLPPRKFKEWHCCKGLQALSDKPFILYQGPAVVEQGIRQLCLAARIAPRVTMESENPAAIAELVKLGLGYSVLPEWTVGEAAARRELTTVPCPPLAVYHYGLICRPGLTSTRTGSALRRIAAHWDNWWPLARFARQGEALRHTG